MLLSLILQQNMPIEFHTEEPLQFTFQKKTSTTKWLEEVIKREGGILAEEGDLNYIFCTDDYLYQMNVEYLQHDTLTDVITFDNSEDTADKIIEGDIFISLDRVRDNAQSLNNEEEVELNRVIVHGLLHLLGYGDKTPADERLMRQKEDFYLAIFIHKTER